MVTSADVTAAARRLRGVANRTPVLNSRTLDAATGARVFVKAEGFQRTGSFKFRGAYNAVSELTEAERAGGVVAESSGNFGQALALAARLHDTSATVLMPADAPDIKVSAVRGYGANVVTFDRYADDYEALLVGYGEEHGLRIVHSFDDASVIAGQGTVAGELIDETGEVDVLVAPVGGGGLIAGCAIALHKRNPWARIVGVEPEASDAMRRSLEAGHLVTIPMKPSIADGLQVSRTGSRPFEVARRLVDEVVTVSESETLAAVRFLFERMKLLVEPSAAVGVAALLARKVVADGKRVGVVTTGANLTIDDLAGLEVKAGEVAGRLGRQKSRSAAGTRH